MPIDDERRQNIAGAAERQAAGGTEAAQSMIRLWQSRIDLALALDDEDVLREIIRGPGGETNLWDNNTNCSGCGGGSGPAHWA